MNDKEKAKAYDEALKAAQCWLNSPQAIEDFGYTVKDAIQNIFPALKESEDDRIRKAVLEVVSDIDGGWPFEKHRITKKEAITYLEKQKEQKPFNVCEQCPYYKDCPDYNEQKSTECIDFDNEFENQVSHLIASALNREYEYNKYFVKYAAHSLLRYAKKEQKPSIFPPAWGEVRWNPISSVQKKPAEWSEEDHNIIEQIIMDYEGEIRKLSDSTIDRHVKLIYQKRIDWLNTLFERFNLQPKREWSEEDERILKGIIGKIDHDQTYGVSKVEMLSFLKSLRSHWKPTKEQMDALEEVIVLLRNLRRNTDDRKNLETLREQLKKL